MAEIQTFSDVVITVEGLKLLAAAQIGDSITLTRAAIGDGYLDDDTDASTLTSLVSEVESQQTGDGGTSATVDISKMTVDDTLAQITVTVQNGDTAFYLRELGLFAADADGNEILYAYTNSGDGAYPIPANTSGTVKRILVLGVAVSSTADITANITYGEVTADEFAAEIATRANADTALDGRISILEDTLLGTEYGMRWVTGTSDSSACERCLKKYGTVYTGDNTGLSFTVNEDGSFTSSYSDLPIWGEMERVTLEGQVMVRVPKYYIKEEESDDGYTYLWVCKTKKDGYRCAGIFLQSDGETENDYYYIGAYESGNANPGISASGYQFSTDEKPYTTGYTIAEYREAAQELGDGWGITTIAEVCDFWQILLPIEFCTRDVQSVAAGVCSIIDPPTPDMWDDCQWATGNCDDVENLHGIKILYSTNNAAGASANYNGQTGMNNGANPFVWHGIENPYGCLEMFVDGLTIYKGVWYSTNDRSAFASDTADGYTQLSYSAPTEGGYSGTTYTEGYPVHLTRFDDDGAPYVALPDEVDDETIGTNYSDLFYAYIYPSGTRYYYPAFGGDCGSIFGYVGAWALGVDYSSTFSYSYVGSRLSYSPA